MNTIIIIILIVAAVYGLAAYMSSAGESLKERAANATIGAAGGAMAAIGCLVQLLVFALLALGGLWVLGKLLGH
jgi:hypothetical protein